MCSSILLSSLPGIKKTQVAACPEDNSYPTQWPVLPSLKAAASISHVCMVSLVAAVTEEGRARERQVAPGRTKPVANLKMATGATNMAAAFWESLAEKMGLAQLQQVCRLGWVLLKQEGAGKFIMRTVAAATVDLEEGQVATAVQDGLAAPSDMVSMSTQYGQTDAMRQRLVKTDDGSAF